MTTTEQNKLDLEIKSYSKENLPKDIIEELSKLIKLSSDELLGLPTPTLEYYIKSLNMPKNTSVEEFWVLATEKGNLLGIGKIFYNINECRTSSNFAIIFVLIRP